MSGVRYFNAFLHPWLLVSQKGDLVLTDIVTDNKPDDVHLIDIIPDILNDSEHNSAAE